MRVGRRAENPATPTSEAAPGFFDRHDRFLQTSTTSAQRDRLNLRYLAMIDECSAQLQGRRVLDIASHDGRWSHAALSAGAAHVSGVEARPELVAAAHDNLRHYGVDADHFAFQTGDAIDSLPAYRDGIDVVLCLGFLYHTLRYNELFAGIRDTGASHLVVDTLVKTNAKGPVIHLFTERSEREGNAVQDRLAHGTDVLVGRPSVAALELMAAAHGYDLVRYTDWARLLGDVPEARGVGDYRAGRRVTGLFARR